MITAIYNRLSGDATLLTTLTGGVHDAQTVQEISRQNTPGAFDANKELKPCALVKMETATPWGPHHDSGRLYVQVFYYQRAGATSIGTALHRVYTLLHRTQLTPTDGSGCYDIRHADDLLGLEDQALECGLAISRYVATIQRAR